MTEKTYIHWNIYFFKKIEILHSCAGPYGVKTNARLNKTISFSELVHAMLVLLCIGFYVLSLLTSPISVCIKMPKISQSILISPSINIKN